MNANRQADPLYAGPRQGTTKPDENTRFRGPSSNSTPGYPSDEPLSARAEKFENEKRRIIESCFTKKDTDGAQIESYITHIRIIEDASYPSSPPPPTSSGENKKPRVIIVAVRKSGIVGIHKARENATGTFSIGKTWDLASLGPIQSYQGVVPTNSLEQQHKQWASDVGFLVTLGKPYYWQALSVKEKDFFIGSLVKIYRKYTGGKIPDLIGFTDQEKEALTSPASRKATPNLRSESPPLPPRTLADFSPSSPAVNGNRAQSPYAGNTISRDGGQISSQEVFAEPPPSRSLQRPPTRDGQRTPGYVNAQSLSPLGIGGTSRDRSNSMFKERLNASQTQPYPEQQSQQASVNDQIPALSNQPRFGPPNQSLVPPGLQYKSQARSAPQSSTNPEANGNVKLGPFQDPAARQLAGASSMDSLNRSENSQSYSSRPSTAASGRKTPEKPTDKPSISEEPLPDRHRLPIVKSAASFGQRSAQSDPKSDSQSKFSTPLATPTGLKPNQQSSSKPRELPGDDPLPAMPAMTEYFPAQKNAVQPIKNDIQPAMPAMSDSITTKPITEPPQEENTVSGTSPPTAGDSEVDEDHRPGLGPMIKKKSTKEIASTFRRAAMAATAFHPRAGGAGARLMAQKEKSSSEPDGINAVVPAPLLRGLSSDTSGSGTPDLASPGLDKERHFSPVTSQTTPRVELQRTATEDDTKKIQQSDREQSQPTEFRPISPDKARSRSPGRKRRQRQQADIEKYCTVLGIDPKFIDSRGGDYMDLLEELGWDGRLAENRGIEDFQADVRREIGRAQATGWLGHIEQQDEKVRELGNAFDKVIAECEEFDGLLTLYSHELDTLRDDVEYIEAQSQGLQVQTANQKLLQVELQNLLKTLTISSNELQALKDSSLESPDDIQHAEIALSTLYQAMLKIDPDIRQNKIRQAEATAKDRSGIGVYADTEIGQMRAVREKKEDYQEEVAVFLKRLNHYAVLAFRSAEQRTNDAMELTRGGTATSPTRLDGRLFGSSRQDLWMYNALMLFVREVNSYEWRTLIGSYEICIKNAYQEHFRNHILACKKIVRKPSGDEQDVLFSMAEKDRGEENMSSATRKLTIKRGKTTKQIGSSRSPLVEQQDGKMEAHEVFATAVDQQVKLVAEEQNYITSFFHLSSQSKDDFTDLVSSGQPPNRRRIPNLAAPQSYEPDRDVAKIVEQSMDNIYSSWPTDLQSLADWALSMDPIQTIGIIYTLERCLARYEETNQEYVTGVLRKLHDRLVASFHRFIDTQVTAIEETKVKISKRKGIISFMRVFPTFAAACEAMLPPHPTSPSPDQPQPRTSDLEIRFTLNDAYATLLKAMWDSLTFIAKEPAGQGTAVAPSAAADPEDKEALNYHILLIENAHHLGAELDAGANVVLADWLERAAHDMHAHLRAYADAVVRRPLGKWLDFVESSEARMAAAEAGGESAGGAAAVAAQPSHGRSAAKKVLAAHDAREIRKGVDALRKRVEKHFADVVDDGALAGGRGLVRLVLDECALRYGAAWARMRTLLDRVYADAERGGLEIDWRPDEVAALFSR